MDQREDVLRTLGRVLVVMTGDNNLKAPLMTLGSHCGEIGSLYTALIEKHLKPEYLLGAEKFWKIIRSDQNLETWRPRVHGTQLKALANCRLPETDEEYGTVVGTLNNLHHVLRPESSPQSFVAELKKFKVAVEAWWDGRNKKSSEGSAKRPGSAAPSGGSRQLKRPNTAGDANYSLNIAHAPGLGLLQQVAGLDQGAMLNLYGSGWKSMHSNGMKDESPPPEDSPEHHYGHNAQDALVAGNGRTSFTAPSHLPGMPQVPVMQHLQQPSKMKRDARNIISLNVGGTMYTTSIATLMAVPGSFFWIFANSQNMDDLLPKLPTGEYFIDRNAQLFLYILEYMRSQANRETTSPLPTEPGELAALAREAEYFQLPGLMDRIAKTPIVPQPLTKAQYDSLYLETGFNSIEGASLKEMEARKVVCMQQMNHVLSAKEKDGFYTASCDCGVAHREGPDGSMQHNLYYHILLKKVMPAFNERM